MLVRSIRAEFRRHEALDTSSERRLEKGVLCSNCGWYVSQARHYGVLVSKDAPQSIIVVVVHFYCIDCLRDPDGLPMASECLYAKACCIERVDD